MNYRFLVAVLSTSCLISCAGQVSRPTVISDTTISHEVREGAKRHEGSSTGSTYALFIAAAENAYPAKVTDPVDPAQQRLLMQIGFDLVKDRCRAYLAAKSDRQRSVNI